MGALLVCGTASRTDAHATFQGLGDLPGGTVASFARGLSADGSTVVGDSQSDLGREAFLWSQATGMVGLGDFPGGSFDSIAYALSADGSVVVGFGRSSSNQEAFRWTAVDGMVGLGVLPSSFGSVAQGVSSDGLVVVGGGGNEGFRWTPAEGMIGIGDLPGGGTHSVAYGVSADGQVVVGRSHSGVASDYEAFCWTPSTGMIALGDLPGGHFVSEARDASADGSVIVGAGYSNLGPEACRWTAGGVFGLGDLAGGQHFSRAFAVSDDGSIIVGAGRTSLGDEAFIWDSANGMRRLQDVLENEHGLDLTGWRLWEAMDVSADGNTVVGYGVHDGHWEAWLVRLTPPNEPPTADPGGPYLVAVNDLILLDATASSDPDDDDLDYLWTLDVADTAVLEDTTLAMPWYWAGGESGIFTLGLEVDDGIASDSAETLVVVYDPDGGFVTGGGWIWSDPGAYVADPLLEGRANFGFVSRYTQGAQIPTGNTEFQFKVADLSFDSDSYEWLVVNQAGTNAQFKGDGTINGEACPTGENYRFMIWATDDDPDGDTFRIRIWWEDEIAEEHDVYDCDATFLGGGNIKVH